ncbi:MAG TPA: site-specific integrase [Terriglobales bacterium]|nr:site-specific integrase [Terriglobales bacterium]
MYKRGNIWWISYWGHETGGSPLRESMGPHGTRELAEKVLFEKIMAIRGGQHVSGNPTVRDLFPALLADYENKERRSIDDARTRWTRHLEPFFGDTRAQAITSDQIQRYIDRRKEESASAATINRERALLLRAYKLGTRSRPPKVTFVPDFPKLREAAPRAGFIDESQADKIAHHCAMHAPWLRALFALLFEWGLRIGEAINLRVSQLDITTRILHLDTGTTKSGEGREVMLTAATFELVRACCAGRRPEDHIFTRNGERIRDFRRTWEKVTAAAGCAGLLVHDLRRSAVRRMIQRGIPQHVAMKISGHKTEQVFRRYAIVATGDLRDAAIKMERPPQHTHDTQSRSGERDGVAENAINVIN